MLRPFSDSRQVLRVIHPNITYSVRTPSRSRLFTICSFAVNFRRSFSRLLYEGNPAVITQEATILRPPP